MTMKCFFFFSSRRRHTRSDRDWSSDVCSSDLAQGRTTGVHYFDSNKGSHFQPARAVVLSANGAETTRLLLNSTSNRFPQGLANSSGMVGKHLMFNQGSGVQGLFEHNLNEYKSV